MMRKHAMLFLAASAFCLASCNQFVNTSSASKLSSEPVNDSSSSSSTSSSSSQSNSSSSSSVTPIVGGIEITQSAGLLESAYVEWAPLAGATGYNVYVSKLGDENWVQLDNELIRKYPSYWRADALGLAKGSYRLKVAPIQNEVAKSEDASTTGELIVTSYDRSGYAFYTQNAVGAYQASGTLKDNAVVLYVSNDNFDSISETVQTSSSGTTSLKGIMTILTGLRKGHEKRPFDVRFLGKINVANITSLNKGDLVVDGGSVYKAGLTLEGVGDDATAYGWGIRYKNAINQELRNLGFMLTKSEEGDDVGLQQSNSMMWIHNNDFFYGEAGHDHDQAKGDGALDTKKSAYVTLTYNHYWDNGKASLMGLSEGEGHTDYVISFHHNWFDHSDSRHPRIRYFRVHVYNNYYDGCSKYGVGASEYSNAFVENNYFRNTPYPIESSMDGSDYKNSLSNGNKGTFSNENSGIVKAYNNVMITPKSYIPYIESKGIANQSSYGYDCYEVTRREDTVPNTFVGRQGGYTYDNFDTTKPDPIDWGIAKSSDVPSVVTHYAGRQQGGDFTWTFDNKVDDISHDVNTKLKAALSSYMGQLVSVGGNSVK